MARAAELSRAHNECGESGRHQPPGGWREPRNARTQPGDPGARTVRGQPDSRGEAAWPEPRSDTLPDREVQPHADRVLVVTKPDDLARADTSTLRLEDLRFALDQAAIV